MYVSVSNDAAALFKAWFHCATTEHAKAHVTASKHLVRALQVDFFLFF